MKKLIICLIIFILTVIILFNVVMQAKIKSNNDIVEKLDELIIKKSEVTIESISNFPSMEIDNNDYIGFVSFNDKIIPIEKEEKIFKSAYLNENESLIIEGTSLKNSFDFYNLLSIGDNIDIINMIGEKNIFKINSIKRTNKKDDIKEYNNDLIISIKNYSEFNYLLVLCDMNG